MTPLYWFIFYAILCFTFCCWISRPGSFLHVDIFSCLESLRMPECAQNVTLKAKRQESKRVKEDERETEREEAQVIIRKILEPWRKSKSDVLYSLENLYTLHFSIYVCASHSLLSYLVYISFLSFLSLQSSQSFLSFPLISFFHSFCHRGNKHFENIYQAKHSKVETQDKNVET